MAAERTRLVLDRAHDAVISLDERGLVTYWNPSASQMFGIEADQALGRPVAELIIPERYREAHWAGIRRFLAEGVGPMLDRRVELEALRAGGDEFAIEMTITAVREGSGWAFTGFVRDISWPCPRSPIGERWTCATPTATAGRWPSRTSTPRACAWPSSCAATSRRS